MARDKIGVLRKKIKKLVAYGKRMIRYCMKS